MNHICVAQSMATPHRGEKYRGGRQNQAKVKNTPVRWSASEGHLIALKPQFGCNKAESTPISTMQRGDSSVQHTDTIQSRYRHSTQSQHSHCHSHSHSHHRTARRVEQTTRRGTAVAVLGGRWGEGKLMSKSLYRDCSTASRAAHSASVG